MFDFHVAWTPFLRLLEERSSYQRDMILAVRSVHIYVVEQHTSDGPTLPFQGLKLVTKESFHVFVAVVLDNGDCRSWLVRGRRLDEDSLMITSISSAREGQMMERED